ncbi:MAG: hypothetical protein KGL50_12835 [Burkholderiales bacterium]|nr:hypothetical protein [Burkholderiales bacterium]
MDPSYARPETRRRSGSEAPLCDEGRPAWTRSEAFAEDVADLLEVGLSAEMTAGLTAGLTGRTGPAQVSAAAGGMARSARPVRPRRWFAWFGLGPAPERLIPAR